MTYNEIYDTLEKAEKIADVYNTHLQDIDLLREDIKKSQILGCKCMEKMSLPTGFSVVKGGFVPNSHTREELDKDKYRIKVTFLEGRLLFLNLDDDWSDPDLTELWNSFLKDIKSYNPVDWDDINKEYLFDIEDGKRLINDFPRLLKEYKTKFRLKRKQVRIKNLRKEADELELELGEMPQ